ncbi:hypothetical protein CRN76_12725 [Chryseobacterium indologenes]|uniref:DUF6850 family outer membrane beta-barrel protein n=1 Tax=Chryseobacterium indologenes TaxID=253 RepID=UPI000BFB5579|nr:DUF6850 family outer membrane beta-barrel protein [Chryseobacterium indologenes]ATN06204.1 hypothetical protein CRN76_12725 [Chryseobacterium indologenes]AYY85036.1 hypothetical protein EGX91_11015 [Chryseobacterium indologenes]QIX81919.1 hypothetical protein FOB56_12060 [Chryseobacterium indologenes]UDQ55693.1 hypothetical protein LJF28_08520 [Chryseobacterium indologenes]HAO27337.1 hypothetical protein [Chryseobacterium indologenes]
MRNKKEATIQVFQYLMVGLALFGSQFLYAQTSHLDSINISTVEKNIRIDNPYLSFFKPLDFSQTSFQFSTLKQNFKRVQSPDKITSFNFRSEGVYKLNSKIALSGRLMADKTAEDNVPYILSDERTTDASFIYNPSYYWAPRSARWQKQSYFINGQFAYNPVKPVILQVGAEGRYAKSYRQNADPRPQVDDYTYKAFGKVGLKWHQHTIFGKMSYLNHYKNINIMFVNANLHVPANDSIYIRYNEGYGNQYIGNTQYKYSEYKAAGYIWGGEYAFNSNNTHLSVGYDYKNVIERFYRGYEYQDASYTYHKDYTKYSGLKTDLHSFYLNFLGNYNGKKWASSVTYMDQLDTNYNYPLEYRSYRLEQQNLNWQNSVIWFNHKNEAFKIRLDAAYGKNHVKDISVVMDRRLSYVNYRLGAEKEFVLMPSHKLSVGITQTLYLPLEKEFNYQPYQSSKENIFVTKIAQPDFAYDATSKLGLAFNAGYIFDHGKIRYELFGNFTQIWIMNSTYKNAVDYNGSANQMASVGLNVYY